MLVAGGLRWSAGCDAAGAVPPAGAGPIGWAASSFSEAGSTRGGKAVVRGVGGGRRTWGGADVVSG